jgi:peptidoglycan/xylan/chitin deacetylase (PgdA/CDA1 family)
MSVAAQARRLGTSILHSRLTRRAALRMAAACNRALVLVFHRVDRGDRGAHEFVPSLPAALFRWQLQALATLGEIVPLARLFDRPPASTPRFAITFDDDDVRHVSNALPILDEAGAPATFFLSGRILHRLPPYWWTLVEHSLRLRGFETTRRLLGLPGRTPEELALALECSPRAEQIVEALSGADEPLMAAADVRTLVRAGMTIGFHTLHHPIVSRLSGPELDAAMTLGRRDLESAAGTPIDFFAYPFGRANAAAAAAAERAGFRAAFATGGRPITPRSDPFMLARWEPGMLHGDAFVAAVALRLLRPPALSRGDRDRRYDERQ